MRVRLTTDRAGPGFFQQEGEVVDLAEEEGRQLLQAGQAEPPPDCEAEPPPPLKPTTRKR